jgi:hypothetical protein
MLASALAIAFNMTSLLSTGITHRPTADSPAIEDLWVDVLGAAIDAAERQKARAT